MGSSTSGMPSCLIAYSQSKLLSSAVQQATASAGVPLLQALL
jgi:hypothetical protein